ncbi:hypothetical protein H7698_02060 [Pseudomonas sp. p50]|uniref:hypothetical protein n=1 Tax=Pseudomonas sp. p50(2008) TaxID=2816832 RepID=UPI00188C33C8|nr:hypothetical protein [Pseudomonas sp. p50(2008)]MBF4554841.1 hypothetical protein [Pseudomonas sp. p50(2008)]
MDKTNKMKCIYCPSTGPFSDEHVFPAGMGGDDKNYLLVDLVCKNCNTGIFSKLELSLMRRSPTGLGRQFLQTNTRDRGARTTKPTIETKSHFIIDTDGRLLEADYDNDGSETLLAQCIIDGEQILYTAQDLPHLKKMYIALSEVLEAPTIDLITKIRSDRVSYVVETYEWRDDEYKQLSSTTFQKPPALGVWLEASDSKTNISPRFFQRLAGQLVLRNNSSINNARLLRSMRRTLPSLQNKQDDATPSSIDQPVIQIEMAIDINETERALAKIGINFLAHQFGAQFISNPKFEDIKSSILTGNPKLPFSSFGEEDKKSLTDLFGNPPKHCHCVMLIGVPTDNSRFDIYFNARLYGTGSHKILLAQNLPMKDFFNPIYFLINYESNTITTMNLLDYQLEFGVLVQEFLESSQNN